MRASLYEAGKTVLRYDARPGSAPLSPSSQEIIYGPFHSESSHTSEGSQETGDSGHYSNEESNEEISNPSTSQSSRTESSGSDNGTAATELKESFQVENEGLLSHSFHQSAADASWLSSTSKNQLPALQTSEAASSWHHLARLFCPAAEANAISTSFTSWEELLGYFLTDKGSGN